MARTLRSYLTSILCREGFSSQGEMFRDAQMIGYSGEQEKLVDAADRLAEKGVLDLRIRGIHQNKWYRLVA